MNLINIEVPSTNHEMIAVYESYYDSFYLEMVRMSNSNLTAYVNEFIEMLVELSKYPASSNIIRCSIGIVSLHSIGYRDFSTLIKIFDRIIPQVDTEYVKFTSWCAGRLIHHPDAEKSRYVSHLFERCLDWTRSIGRRARPLAAAHLLHALSQNAGSNVVVFFPQLQSAIWQLVSHFSTSVLKATANAIYWFTHAIINYGRSDLEEYMKFFSLLCYKLLTFGDPIREYASLLLFEQLILKSPEYFVPKLLFLYGEIQNNVIDEPMLVKGASYCMIASMAKIDSKVFVEHIADELLLQTDDVLLEFPTDVVKSLCFLIETIPTYMETKIDELKSYVNRLLGLESESALVLLTGLLKKFEEKCFPIEQETIDSLINAPFTTTYKDFFIIFMKYQDKFPESVPVALSARLLKELNEPNPLIALKTVSHLPKQAIVDGQKLLGAVAHLSTSPSPTIRRKVPLAMYNISTSIPDIQIEQIIKKMLQLAVFDHSLLVRSAVLQVLYKNCSITLAQPEFMKFFQVFANDDATSVRKITFKILAKLTKINPISVSSITRSSLLDSFFIIKHVPSIRQRARIVRTLPYLITASSMTIKAYSAGFMEIALDILEKHNMSTKFSNFLEEDANINILIGIIDSLSLLAPLDPKQVSMNADCIVTMLCNFLLTYQNRSLHLAILNLLYTLLTAPASTITYRAKVPEILAACSNFLASTRSRKGRMALLKVIGAVGVLEVHQKAPPLSCESPENIDDSLARQFFHPLRDADGDVDDSLLLQSSTTEQYFVAVAASSLLEIFKDDTQTEYFIDAVQGLVQILHHPRMHMLAHFDSFIARLLEVMEKSDIQDLKQYLPLYSQLIAGSTHNTAPFLAQSLQMISERFCPQLAPQFLDLILSFLEAIRDGFSPYASDTICLLVGCLDDAKTSNISISHRVLKAFSIIGVFATDLLYLIIPQVCDAVECEQTLEPVRIMALKTLTSLVVSVDLFPYIGPIVRALQCGLFYPDKETNSSAFELLYMLLRAQGSNFLINAEPLFESLRNSGVETPELKEIVLDVARGVYGSCFAPIDDMQKPPPSPKPGDRKPTFSEDAITARAMTPNLGLERHLEQWLRSFVLCVISNSPSEAIRACTTLATSLQPLAMKLFNPAFLSCWREMTEKGRQQLISSFRELLLASENYETVARTILNLIFFMDKTEQPLTIPEHDIVKACMRYGGVALALQLQQKHCEQFPDDVDNIKVLIDIYIQLGDWVNAVGVWKKVNMKSGSMSSVDELSRLQMWEEVQPRYAKRFAQTHEFESFNGLVRSLSAMAMWNQIMSFFCKFRELKLHQKLLISPCFAEAALHLGSWDLLKESLEYAPDDSARCISLKAILALHNKDYTSVDKLVQNGFSLLASKPITFWGDNQQIHRETMLSCQELVEISEMKQWLLDKNTEAVEEVWNARLKTAPRDFDLWLGIIVNRTCITGIRDENLIKLFQFKSKAKGTKIHINAFDIIFPKFDIQSAPDLHKICYVVAHWNAGERTRALEEMEKLTRSVQDPLLVKCRFIYSKWVLEVEDTFEGLKKAYAQLHSIMKTLPYNAPKHGSKLRKASSSNSTSSGLILPSQIFQELTSDINQIEMLRKWADVNATLIPQDPERLAKYVTNAIDALTRCATLSPSFPDVVQLLNLFFEYADQQAVFVSTANSCIEKLAPKLLLQASPQILVQLSHPTKHVSKFVHDIVFKLLLDHYHALIFSVIVLRDSQNVERAQAARQILEEFRNAKPDLFDEVMLIRETLLMAAVTWNERALSYIDESFDHFQRGDMSKMKDALQAIRDLVEEPKCQMHDQFKKQFGKNITQLESILKIFNPSNTTCMNQVSQWCKTMQDVLTEELKRIRMIQLAAISPELCERTNFNLAVPGTYKPTKPLIRIEYFVGQFSVYMTKQQPKDVVIKGEDGKFYQYLLKGHEDLRLDERIMQFFRLINSLIIKEIFFNANVIQTTNVIPLSISHGLVQWVPGTDTLRAIVETNRKIHRIDPMIEYGLTEKFAYGNVDSMLPVQKMQMYERIFQEVSDNDLADFFWLKAPNADIWLKQINTFAMSTAMTSIVGYIIGLGDRHPSNLLIDKITGKVVHIDFGDCFEKAALRKYLPEVVPFRLTRMMVKAMGPTGVEGLFKSSFINMSTLLRENHRVLTMVLSIFVHEPLVDPTTDSPLSGSPDNQPNVSSSVEMSKRVKQKLTGADFGTDKPLTVEQQATKLISAAVDLYNLSKMYSGWCPFW